MTRNDIINAGAILITCDGSIEQIFPQDETFTQIELDELVGGYAQSIWLSRKLCMHINTEAYRYNLGINARASEISKTQVLGNAVICTNELI